MNHNKKREVNNKVTKPTSKIEKNKRKKLSVKINKVPISTCQSFDDTQYVRSTVHQALARPLKEMHI